MRASRFILKTKKGGYSPMNEVKNLNDKRVCDVSTDERAIEIKQKDCVTRITANPDGTLKITQHRTSK